MRMRSTSGRYLRDARKVLAVGLMCKAALAVGCENLHALRGRIFAPNLAPKPALWLVHNAP